MARSIGDSKEETTASSNGYHNGHDTQLHYTHNSKRKRTQKPKPVKPSNNSQIVESILKADSNGNGSVARPCRRSERKIIPSSLWDNAVINPFFERKRRKLSDSPVKSKPPESSKPECAKSEPDKSEPDKSEPDKSELDKPEFDRLENGKSETAKSCSENVKTELQSSQPDNVKRNDTESVKPKRDKSDSEPSNLNLENVKSESPKLDSEPTQLDLETVKSDSEIVKSESAESTTAESSPSKENTNGHCRAVIENHVAVDSSTAGDEENHSHVRLRRSSRKHSSSVSSIYDTKYTIKQERSKLGEPPGKEEMDCQQETVSDGESTDLVSSDLVSTDVIMIEDDDTWQMTSSPEKKEEMSDKELIKQEEMNGETPTRPLEPPSPPPVTSSTSPLTSPTSPVTSSTSPVTSPTSPVTSSTVKSRDYDHVGGCQEDDAISGDDEIEIQMALPTDAAKENDEKIEVAAATVPESEKVFVDKLGRRGKRRGRKPRAEKNGELGEKMGKGKATERKGKIEEKLNREKTDEEKIEQSKKKKETIGKENKEELEKEKDEKIEEKGEQDKTVPTSDEVTLKGTVKRTPTPDEITLSSEGMLSKEALQLIDGSSFQRFYKMRTRRQNSSADESSSSTKKRRASSRSNSGNSKEEGGGEVKRRARQVKPDILCSFCLQTEDERGEQMISCCLCGASGHPSCLQFNVELTERVKLYNWECIECKKCELCRNSGDDATLLFCDNCDKGFHMGCLKPALQGEPDGHWSCLYCVEGSNYWDNKIAKSQNLDKSPKRRKSDKPSKRKQLLDDLAMFHEAQSRAQTAMAEEVKLQPKLKTPKKKATGAVPPSIKSIELGCYEITTWYSSPYPAEYALQNKLYICEFCLKYMKSGVIASRHTAKCPARCPPGDEIYRKDTVSVFEVDGRKNKTYCQNLCLLAKLFLDHKTLYYDVEPFLFYILTEYDRKGCHIVGYFSKEKNSFLSYNVSCILVIPPYMKKGYGKMLIDFSYALSRKEGKLGSPEKPLSDLGLVSYRNYWKEKLLEYFVTYSDSEITIKNISQTLGFNPYDIVSTLQAYGMIKYYKSHHYVLKRPEMLSAFKRKQAAHSGLPSRSIDMSKLKWTPPQKRQTT